MAKTPPLLPSETLARVVHIASRDGRVLLFLAGGCALLSAAGHNGFGALVGLLVAGMGALELHGVTLLQHGESRGLNWLVRSQLLLLAIMLMYAAVSLSTYDEAAVNARITPAILKQLETVNAGREQFLAFARLVHAGLYTIVGVVSIFYQGGLAFYYQRKRAAINQALAEKKEGDPVDDFAG